MADTPTGNAPAPATPAPAPAPVQTSEAPKSNIELASEAARASIQETGTAVPPTGDPVQEPGDRGRRGDGTFRPGPPKGERPEPAPPTPPAPAPAPEPVAAAPDAGQAAETDDLPADEPEVDETTEGAPTGDEGPEDKLRVVGPGRREDEDFEIVAQDEETANRLRSWANDAARVQEAETLREEAANLRREVEEFQEMLAIDPDEIVLKGLEGNVEAQRHLALFLLTRPEIWAQVKDTVLSLDDTERFELVQAKVEVERVRLRDQFKTVVEENRAVDQNLREVQSAVAAIIPADMNAAARAQFTHDALNDIARYADRYGHLTVNVRDIPLIIAHRLQASGIDPVDAARRIAAPPARRNRSTENRTVSSAPANRAPATPPKPPQRTAQQMVQGARRKRVAASIPPVGAGAPSAASEKPPYDPSLGTSATEQALAWHRARVQAAKPRT